MINRNEEKFNSVRVGTGNPDPMRRAAVVNKKFMRFFPLVCNIFFLDDRWRISGRLEALIVLLSLHALLKGRINPPRSAQLP